MADVLLAPSTPDHPTGRNRSTNTILRELTPSSPPERSNHKNRTRLTIQNGSTSAMFFTSWVPLAPPARSTHEKICFPHYNMGSQTLIFREVGCRLPRQSNKNTRLPFIQHGSTHTEFSQNFQEVGCRPPARAVKSQKKYASLAAKRAHKHFFEEFGCRSPRPRGQSTREPRPLLQSPSQRAVSSNVRTEIRRYP